MCKIGFRFVDDVYCDAHCYCDAYSDDLRCDAAAVALPSAIHFVLRQHNRAAAARGQGRCASLILLPEIIHEMTTSQEKARCFRLLTVEVCTHSSSKSKPQKRNILLRRRLGHAHRVLHAEGRASSQHQLLRRRRVSEQQGSARFHGSALGVCSGSFVLRPQSRLVKWKNNPFQTAYALHHDHHHSPPP